MDRVDDEAEAAAQSPAREMTAESVPTDTSTDEPSAEALEADDGTPARLAETWALGAVATMLLVFVALTGAGLLFYYRPTPQLAMTDLADLREVARLGFLREWHLWGSHALVIVVILHLVRTFLHGTYRRRRRGWLTGVVLLVLTALLAFTGTLLPWTQEGWWGVEAFLGHSPTEGTLHLFFVLHCIILPVAIGVLAFDHLRVARASRE